MENLDNFGNHFANQKNRQNNGQNLQNYFEFASVFGVPIAKITRKNLQNYLEKSEKGQKIGLNFAYSEVVLRANRNQFYQKAISGIINICDGKGLKWSLWKSQKYAKIRQKLTEKLEINEIQSLEKSKRNFQQNNQENNQENNCEIINEKNNKFELYSNACQLAKSPFQGRCLKDGGYLKGEFVRKVWRKCVLWILILWELFGNFGSVILILIGFDFEKGVEIILGRDFVYDLFDLSLQKGWKIAVIGGSPSVKKALEKKFENKLDIDFWFAPSDSDLMRDLPQKGLEKTENQNSKTTELSNNLVKIDSKSEKTLEENELENNHKNLEKMSENPQKKIQDKFQFQAKNEQNRMNLPQTHSFLKTETLLQNFPPLEIAQNWLEQKNADLVLICIGGASGKQEFFLDLLRQNDNLNFNLGVCLGAALDHLGSGKSQKESPKIMQKMGLEWLFRLVFQPYRRTRIWDSVWTLFWWTSLGKFVPTDRQINLQNAE